MKILAIDIGGSHVKVLRDGLGTEEKRSADSGPTMGPVDMVRAVHDLGAGWDFDVIAIGYPGPVLNGRAADEPRNLGKGWVDFDFEAAFGKPVRVMNDAAMQALGSYQGGKMLFLGLGTGLGAALVTEGVVLPLELAHLPYRKGRTYEDYLGEAARRRRGTKKWERSVHDVAERFLAAFLVDDLVLGGGNVKHVETLPERCRRGENENAFLGGFRLWDPAIAAPD